MDVCLHAVALTASLQSPKNLSSLPLRGRHEAHVLHSRWEDPTPNQTSWFTKPIQNYHVLTQPMVRQRLMQQPIKPIQLDISTNVFYKPIELSYLVFQTNLLV